MQAVPPPGPVVEELLAFFKVLADANRLRILGLLAGRELSTGEIAAILGISPGTVSHHLARLAGVGLVQARAESYYSLYSLRPDALQERARRLLGDGPLRQAAAGLDLDAHDRKVLTDFSRPDGSLRSIPSQRKKREAVLRRLGGEFEPGRRYPEKEVNCILGRFHPDTATLRRELVGYGWLKREKNVYWRT